MKKIEVTFTDGETKSFPFDTFNPNYCDCLKITKVDTEDVHIPLRNVRTWKAINA